MEEYCGILLNMDGRPDYQGNIIDIHTRIDFYSLGNRVFVDSLTHTPSGLVGKATIVQSNDTLTYGLSFMSGLGGLRQSLELLVPTVHGKIISRSKNYPELVLKIQVESIFLVHRAVDDRLTPLNLNVTEHTPTYKVSAISIKCECGSEKAGTGTHSDWCPKGGETVTIQLPDGSINP